MKNQPNKPDQTRTPTSNVSSSTMGKQHEGSNKQGSSLDRDVQRKTGSSQDHGSDKLHNPSGHKDR